MAALIYSVSLVVAAREWWQFFSFAIMLTLSVTLFLSGARGLLERRRRRRLPREKFAGEYGHPDAGR